MKTTNDLRRENEALILRTIQQNKVISKREISRLTGLSQVSVHNTVNNLIDLGICRESNSRVSTGGRNAALFQLNNEYGAIIGLTLYRHHLMTTVFDFAFNKLYQTNKPNNLSNMSETIQLMKQEIHSVRSKLAGWNFIGIGVAMPGRVKSDGTVIHIPGFKMWDHVPLRTILDEEFGIPVCIDNDNNALAISAKYNGLIGDISDYVYLRISEGLGIGVVIDNCLYHGHNGCGCEIGHTSVLLDGPVCTCGNRGCLDVFLSDTNILSSINARLQASCKPELENLGQVSSSEAMDAASPIGAVLQDSLRYASIAIEHIFRIYGTQAVILNCKWLSVMPGQQQQIIDSVFSKIPWLRRDHFSILFDDGNDITNSAAACLFFDRFMSNSI